MQVHVHGVGFGLQGWPWGRKGERMRLSFALCDVGASQGAGENARPLCTCAVHCLHNIELGFV